MSKLRVTRSPSVVPWLRQGPSWTLCHFDTFLSFLTADRSATSALSFPCAVIKTSCEHEVSVGPSCDQRPRSVPCTYVRSTFSRCDRRRDTYQFLQRIKQQMSRVNTLVCPSWSTCYSKLASSPSSCIFAVRVFIIPSAWSRVSATAIREY